MIQFFNYSHRFDSEFSAAFMYKVDQVLETDPCCNDFPNCLHPKVQTSNQLFNKNIKVFDDLKESLIDACKKYFEREVDVGYVVAWAYRNDKGREMRESQWHHHKNEDIDVSNMTELSAIMYMTDTDLGTEIDTEHFRLRIKPKLFHWFLWPANLLHRPEPGITNHTRFVIASTIGIYNVPKNNS